MAMMVTMTVVVAENTTMVLIADPRIDVSEAVFHDASLVAPNFLFENGTATPTSEVAGVVDNFLRFGSSPGLLPGHGKL
jgi:hypothetical protein